MARAGPGDKYDHANSSVATLTGIPTIAPGPAQAIGFTAPDDPATRPGGSVFTRRSGIRFHAASTSDAPKLSDQVATAQADSSGVWLFGRRRLGLLIVIAGIVVRGAPAYAASVDVAEGFPRTARPGEVIAVSANLDDVERCTFRVGHRVATVGVAGASNVSFRFRVARATRSGSIQLVLRCLPAAAQNGTLRVRSARRGGTVVAGPIRANVLRAPAPNVPPASPPASVWLSQADALSRAQADWTQYGDAYLSVFRNGQCTDWVEQKRPDIVERGTVQLWAAYLAGDGSAVANWNGGFWDDTARAAGLEVGEIPRAGAVVTFDPGTQGITAATGHVAYVESVDDDGSAFTVSEMNAPLPYVVSYRRIPTSALARGGISFVY